MVKIKQIEISPNKVEDYENISLIIGPNNSGKTVRAHLFKQGRLASVRSVCGWSIYFRDVNELEVKSVNFSVKMSFELDSLLSLEYLHPVKVMKDCTFNNR